jgi:predicted phosphodiesterase
VGVVADDGVWPGVGVDDGVAGDGDDVGLVGRSDGAWPAVPPEPQAAAIMVMAVSTPPQPRRRGERSETRKRLGALIASTLDRAWKDRVMPLDRIALLSDVHGNLTALEAVLSDIEARGITRILNLGDYVGKGPRGSEAVDRCRETCAVNIRGNWDDFIPSPPADVSPAVHWWRDQLRSDQLTWLANLPLAHDLLVSGRRIRLFHASATSVHTRVLRNHTEDEFAGMFATTPLTGRGPEPSIVGYGDIHSAYVTVRGGRTVFNAGSVGNPLDEPTAVYVVLEGVLDEPEAAPFGMQFVRVPYDIEAELAVARDMGMPELDYYAVELREGLYRGAQKARATAASAFGGAPSP